MKTKEKAINRVAGILQQSAHANLSADTSQLLARRIVSEVFSTYDDLVAAAFAALVLCNGLSKEERTIAYNGRDDFDVSIALRKALVLAGMVGE